MPVAEGEQTTPEHRRSGRQRRQGRDPKCTSKPPGADIGRAGGDRGVIAPETYDDRVVVELSPYDLSKGRIVYRYK